MQIVRTSRNMYIILAHLDKQVSSSLHTVLKPFLLRRIKNEVHRSPATLVLGQFPADPLYTDFTLFFPQVLQDLPVKSEVILYTGLSVLQKKLYKAILMKDTGL